MRRYRSFLPLLAGIVMVLGMQTRAYGIDKVEVLDAPVLIPGFALQTAQGKAFTQNSLIGHYSILVIGFTSCPDVCPFVLTNLQALTKTLSQSHDLQTDIVFTAVDPKRDKPVLAEYVKHFGENITGVTGEVSQLNALVGGMNGAFVIESADADGHYKVKHSAFAVLVSPAGEMIARLNPPLKSKEAAEEIAVLLSPTASIAQRY